MMSGCGLVLRVLHSLLAVLRPAGPLCCAVPVCVLLASMVAASFLSVWLGWEFVRQLDPVPFSGHSAGLHLSEFRPSGTCRVFSLAP